MISSIKKNISNFIALLLSPLLILFYVSSWVSNGRIFAAYAQLLSLIPGKIGSYCWISFYRFSMKFCHFDCVIGFGTLFSQLDTEISQGVYIGGSPQCNIGLCKIGKNCLIASGVHVMSGSKQRKFDDLEIPILQQVRRI